MEAPNRLPPTSSGGLFLSMPVGCKAMVYESLVWLGLPLWTRLFFKHLDILSFFSPSMLSTEQIYIMGGLYESNTHSCHFNSISILSFRLLQYLSLPWVANTNSCSITLYYIYINFVYERNVSSSAILTDVTGSAVPGRSLHALAMLIAQDTR